MSSFSFITLWTYCTTISVLMVDSLCECRIQLCLCLKKLYDRMTKHTGHDNNPCSLCAADATIRFARRLRGFGKCCCAVQTLKVCFFGRFTASDILYRASVSSPLSSRTVFQLRLRMRITLTPARMTDSHSWDVFNS